MYGGQIMTKKSLLSLVLLFSFPFSVANAKFVDDAMKIKSLGEAYASFKGSIEHKKTKVVFFENKETHSNENAPGKSRFLIQFTLRNPDAGKLNLKLNKKEYLLYIHSCLDSKELKELRSESQNDPKQELDALYQRMINHPLDWFLIKGNSVSLQDESCRAGT